MIHSHETIFCVGVSCYLSLVFFQEATSGVVRADGFCLNCDFDYGAVQLYFVGASFGYYYSNAAIFPHLQACPKKATEEYLK